MKFLTKPYWIFLSIILPQTAILIYFAGVYEIISSLLTDENINYWLSFSSMILVSLVVGLGYAIYLHHRQHSISWIVALVALPVYIILTCFYFHYLDEMFPSTIPGWMIPIDEIVFLPLGLMVLAMLHALLLLIEHCTLIENNPSLLYTGIGAISIPAFWYLMFNIVFPLLQGKISWDYYTFFQTVLFVVLTVVFMFLLFRFLYLLTFKKIWLNAKYAALIKVVITLVLPMLTLMVYNAINTDYFFTGGAFQVLGDWSHPGYYVLVLCNGLILSLPGVDKPPVRLGLFVAKATLYPFVFYFFIVLLPLFPLAVDIIIFFGAGILILSPIILFFWQTKSLYEDWRYLREKFNLKIPLLAFSLSLAVVPFVLTLYYLMDRFALNELLEYVFEPDYWDDQEFDLNIHAAQRVLDNVKQAKQRDRWIFSNRKPYLNSYYQWLVLDNLTLSNSKLAKLETIISGQTDVAVADGTNRDSFSQSNAPVLSNVSISTKLSDSGQYYISNIDLEINNSTEFRTEYVTQFRLPMGAWINDYYLMIDGKKVPGILSEKNSALWIYQQIRSVRRDPGIIYYTSADEIVLRVFPFAAGEVRYTGIQVIHKGEVDFDLDGKRVLLKGDSLYTKKTPDSNFILISAEEKSTLPKVTRKPYFHFILDGSERAAKQWDNYIARIEKFVSQQSDIENAKLTWVNYSVETIELKRDWKQTLSGYQATGGFFLERALKRTLAKNLTDHSKQYPIFIVLSDHLENAVFTDGMSGFSVAMPELQTLFVLDKHHKLSPHSVSNIYANSDSNFNLDNLMTDRPVLAWPDANHPVSYLADNGRASLIIRDPTVEIDRLSLNQSTWDNAVQLYARWLTSKLNPRQAGKKHFSIIQDSFKAHVMSPLTSFLSPENLAQEKMMLKKQKQVLASMRSLDAGEDLVMDEPPLWLLAICLLCLMVYTHRSHILPWCLARTCKSITCRIFFPAASFFDKKRNYRMKT